MQTQSTALPAHTCMAEQVGQPPCREPPVSPPCIQAEAERHPEVEGKEAGRCAGQSASSCVQVGGVHGRRLGQQAIPGLVNISHGTKAVPSSSFHLDGSRLCGMLKHVAHQSMLQRRDQLRRQLGCGTQRARALIKTGGYSTHPAFGLARQSSAQRGRRGCCVHWADQVDQVKRGTGTYIS